ncbi:MAG: RluA family pseudouridine synthase [Alphaproteobacteria bacterium]
MRLDRWLSERYCGLTQGIIEKHLRKDNIKVNGEKAKASKRISSDDHVSVPAYFASKYISKHKLKQTTVSEKDVSWIKSLIIYDSEEFCVLNKPSGISVQGGTKISRHLDAFLMAFKDQNRLVHRLDKDTSGVLLVAKTQKMAAYLTGSFKENKIKKTYLGIVHSIPYKKEDLINLPLIKGYKGSCEKIFVDLKCGKNALTHYKYSRSLKNNTSLLELSPRTGRTHQLRVHLASIGHPILGDQKYGIPDQFENLFLHAYSISFVDVEGNTLTFSAPLPSYMADFLCEGNGSCNQYNL